MINVAFFGTSEYSVPSLQKLIDSDVINVKVVVTKQDQKVNRGQKFEESPVAKVARENNIEVCKPVKLKEDRVVIDRLKELDIDYFAVISYGQILSKEILDIPKASINAHASILPKYRGSSPIQTAILNGDKITGVTTMLMDVGLDTGDILKIVEVPINDEDDEESMFNKLSIVSADLLIDTIIDFDNIKIYKQDEEKATKTKLIKKEDGYIDLSYNNEKVFNMVRAYKTWPTCYIEYNEDNMKITKVEKVNKEENYNIKNDSKLLNDRLSIYKRNLYLKTNDGYIKIINLKLPGKKEMDARSFINGIK